MESQVLALGYTCCCGQYVTVFEIEPGESGRLPQRVTVCCANGHTATFTPAHVAVLERHEKQSDAFPLARAA